MTRYVLLLIFAMAPPALGGEPFIPASDDQVLETLPTQVFAEWNELRDLRKRLTQEPKNARLAAAVAGEYVRMGKQGGGPRFFGYARAALGPWWEAEAPPAEVLRVRAKLKETDHAYDLAARDLRTLLARDPQDVQAWIELSNILRVQGDYESAQEAAERLSQLGEELPTILCRVPLMAVTGEAEAAYELLKEALPAAREKLPSVVQWMLTMQADIALALGRDKAAEANFREALDNDPQDSYIHRAYADFLLDHDRPGEVVKLLEDQLSDNGALLRATIAAKRSGDAAQAKAWRDQLASRFEETRLRGDLPHGRYEARFALEVQDDPQAALALAKANWDRQKEARDTRNLLEAALAARDPAAAKPAIDFLRKHQTENVTLQGLVESLEAL